MGTLHWHCHHHPNITESRHNSSPPRPRVLLLIFQTNSYLLCIIILRLDMCSMYLLCTRCIITSGTGKACRNEEDSVSISYVQSTQMYR